MKDGARSGQYRREALAGLVCGGRRRRDVERNRRGCFPRLVSLTAALQVNLPFGRFLPDPRGETQIDTRESPRRHEHGRLTGAGGTTETLCWMQAAFKSDGTRKEDARSKTMTTCAPGADERIKQLSATNILG